MIVKERTIPIRIEMLRALLRRLPLNHRKRPEIEQDLAKRLAGYRGEQALDYYLSRLDKKKYTILHDLRLINEDHYFQIDTLLLSESFAIILEVKNISGTLNFDLLFRQLIRSFDTKEESFPDPLLQAYHQKKNLIQWFAKHRIDPIPVEYIVVISNSSSIIKTNPINKEVYQRVIHVEYLLEKLVEIEMANPRSVIPQKAVQKLSRILVRDDTPLYPNILSTYNLNKDDLLKGVRCPKCEFYHMNRKLRTWYCTMCQKNDQNAHYAAVLDYFLLLDKEMTNQKCREFLKLTSRNIANKLLKSMNLPTSGTKKGTVYHRPLNLSHFLKTNIDKFTTSQ